MTELRVPDALTDAADLPGYDTLPVSPAGHTLAQLDHLHTYVGLGLMWLGSERRAELVDVVRRHRRPGVVPRDLPAELSQLLARRPDLAGVGISSMTEVLTG